MPEANKQKMPHGRKKGGTMFPRIPLPKAIEYAKRLVGKTHTGPQPATIILKGVFDSGAVAGQIRASALKQFGLLKGDSKGYEATDLAKTIASAPPDEIVASLRVACLKATIFKTLYDTFQGDKVNTAKIRQQALNHGVHIDSGDECVRIFVESLLGAELAKQDQDLVDIISNTRSKEKITRDEQFAVNGENDPHSSDAHDMSPADDAKEDLESDTGTDGKRGKPATKSGGSKIPVHLNLDVDSHTDSNELEKKLKLLRQYGVL